MITKAASITALTLLLLGGFYVWGGPRAAAQEGPGAGGSRPRATPAPSRTPRRPRLNRAAATPRRAGAPRSVTVRIITDQPFCNVFIDGVLEDRGTDEQGRVSIPMEPGVYDVSVTKSGYVTEGREVEVRLTPPYVQEERFTLKRVLLPLKVRTNPPGAKVILDGNREGVSDAEGLLTFEKVDPSVEHSLHALKDDYHSETVTVAPYKREAEIRLKLAMRTLTVKTIPAEAQVYLDGDKKGTSDAQGFLVIPKVEAGRAHSVMAAKDGYVTTTEPVAADFEFARVILPPDSPGPTPTPSPIPTPAPAPISIPTPASTTTPASAAAADAGSLDELLRTLDERTSAALARVGPYGLTVSVEEARELSELYERVRKWRPGDQKLQALAEYWTAKYWQAGAQIISSQGGREVYLQKARAAARDAGAFNPRDARVLFDLGWLHRTLGDTDAAVRHFNEAHTLDPPWAYPPFALATIDMRAAEMEVAKAAKAVRYERAIDNFTRAITVNPAFLQAYELRCLAYAVINRHQEAIASGQQAVALKPTSAYAHYALGFAYYQFGLDKDKKQYRNAMNEFNLALTLKDDALDPPTLESVRQKLAAMKKSLGIKP